VNTFRESIYLCPISPENAWMRDASEPVTCQQMREGLTEYLDDALPPSRRQGFQDHLSSCDACRRLLDETGIAIQRLAALPREPMPPEMKKSLLDAFRARP
jgi:anti-sigma factor RsiW